MTECGSLQNFVDQHRRLFVLTGAGCSTRSGIPDYRDTADALVHKDLRLSFDGNRYCVPPRYVGRKLTVKADSSSVAIYDQHQEIVQYARCWERGQTLGSERFQKELYADRKSVV